MPIFSLSNEAPVTKYRREDRTHCIAYNHNLILHLTIARSSVAAEGSVQSFSLCNMFWLGPTNSV